MNKIVVGVIGVILGIGIGLGGYYLITKNVINTNASNNNIENNNDIKQETTEKELSLNDSLVQKYFNMYKYFQKDCIDEELLNNDNDARLHLVLSEIPSSYYETISCNKLNDLTVDDSYYCSSMMFENFSNELDKLKNENTSFINEDIILNKYQEIFGKDSKYQKDDIKTFGGMYHYDSKNKGYAFYRINAGGSCSIPNVTLENAVLKDDILNLIILKDYDEEDINQDQKLNINLKYEKETGNYILDNIISEVQ